MTRNRKTKNTIFKIVEKIKKEYRPEKIILFGSYAHGTPNKNSDVDLFILKSTKKNRIDRFVEVKRIIYYDIEKLITEAAKYRPIFRKYLDFARRVTAYYIEDRYPPGPPVEYSNGSNYYKESP